MSNKFHFIERIFLNSDMSEREFADKVGVPKQTLRYWLGRMRPDVEKNTLSLKSLCKLRKISRLGTKAFWLQIEAEFGKE